MHLWDSKFESEKLYRMHIILENAYMKYPQYSAFYDTE